MTYSREIRDACLAAVARGASLRAASAELGPAHQTIGRWAAGAGVGLRRDWEGGPAMRLSEAGSRPGRLELEHRVAIAAGVSWGLAHARIAEAIGFSRPTVSKELKRHSRPDGTYNAYRAQALADRDAKRPKPRRIDSDPRLRAYVLRGLADGWSPEQVSARMREEFPDEEGMRLSAESIYQAIYVQGKGSLRQELRLEKALRSGRTARAPRSALPPRAGGATWVEGCEISLRPAEADDRAVPGHWEGDLVIGSDLKSCLVTLVERTTRLLVARRLDLHGTELVTSALSGMASGVPAALMRTVTWDRGCEMAGHAAFAAETGVRVYFCDPHSPWQRGTNENTNGLLRQYFPKGTDFTMVTDEEVRRAQDLLNGRPRKTLGWRTPAEAYADYLRQVEEGALTV